jgi:IS30 family transposase
MSHHHFTTFERGKIEELQKIGYTTREIASRLGRHHSSIARELKRPSVSQEYKAEIAQQDYRKKRQNSKPHGKWNEALCAMVAEKLKATWSPEQISHTVTLDRLSFKTIYNWLYTGRLSGLTAEVLRRKGKKRTCRNLAFYAKGTSIRKRPKEVYTRETFGHWELDTVVSAKGVGGCFATFAERKTRFYSAVPMPDRTADSMESAIKYLHALWPKGTFKSATTDRGGEFACYDSIQKDLGLTLYFADPYCPHQRGTNEYGNGLLREFYPKGTNFGKANHDALTNSLFLINSRPRKCLDWFSPFQLFLLELSHLA